MKAPLLNMRIGISHINTLTMKPNQVGISLQNAYAYVLLFRALIFSGSPIVISVN